MRQQWASLNIRAHTVTSRSPQRLSTVSETNTTCSVSKAPAQSHLLAHAGFPGTRQTLSWKGSAPRKPVSTTEGRLLIRG